MISALRFLACVALSFVLACTRTRATEAEIIERDHQEALATAAEPPPGAADARAGSRVRVIDPRAAEGTLIPRSMFDKGKYYLLSKSRKGHVVKTLHKRVGVDGVGWTRVETNCKTMRMRELGYTDEAPEKMKTERTKWFSLVDGSSKSDLARFVCR